ncbi:hypothetical protein HDU98_004719 [Podochytrium sp. JEL0797]|nr:hypothetical protein HDU98_004719 [Podochytrium sp. JEL0797]
MSKPATVPDASSTHKQARIPEADITTAHNPFSLDGFSKSFNVVTGHVGTGLQKSFQATMSVGEAFKTFINRGNVVDLAVGMVVGTAFTAIVKSFVNDLISPIIGLATQKNLANSFLIIRCPKGKNSTGCTTGRNHHYNTVLQANAAGATTWNYGSFIEACINFLLISMAMFFIVQLYSNSFLKAKPAAATTKTCVQCCEECPLKANICKCCLTQFPEPEADEEDDDDSEGGVMAMPTKMFQKMFHKKPLEK